MDLPARSSSSTSASTQSHPRQSATRRATALFPLPRYPMSKRFMAIAARGATDFGPLGARRRRLNVFGWANRPLECIAHQVTGRISAGEQLELQAGLSDEHLNPR